MKGLLILLLTLPLFAEDVPEALTPTQVRHLLREARQLYTSEEPEDLANAARMFRAAAEAADPDEVHLDAVRLAEAMAWMQANQTERALEAFEGIQGFEDAADRARHRNLRGNAHLAAGEQAFAQEEFDAAKEHMESAVQSFIESLQDNPASEDGKRNLEIAHRRLQHVIENTPPPPPPDEDGESDDSDEDDADPDQTDPTDQTDPSDPTDASEPSETPSASEPLPDEDFSEEEAQRTLDALLEQERRLRDEILRNRNRNLQTVPVEKDW